ncbi:MAG: rod shape-determining protein [Gammaproteobacteria bacterium]|jgi:rod shape-determining protein MreB
MFRKIKNLFYDDISIDLGTANTLIYQKHKGIILNEPSVVAITNRDLAKGENHILAVGDEAKKMFGRTPLNIKAIRPLRDGVIANFQVAEKMLQYFIKKIYAERMFTPSTRILICVPCNASQIDCRAIRESAIGAGAKKVFLIEEPMAAAIGVGIDIEKARGSMVIDIGGGTTEIAIMALNGVVYSSSTKIGGDRCDESIINYLKRNFGILVGESTAEFIKMNIGCAMYNDEVNCLQSMNVRGRSVATGVPISVTVTNRDMLMALQEPLQQMINSITTALDAAPPELAGDIIENGIVLTGGGALLTDLDKLLSTMMKLPVTVAPDPLTCVARGGGKVLEMLTSSFDKAKELLHS